MDDEDAFKIKIHGKNYKINFNSDLGHQEILKIPPRYMNFTLLWLIYYIFAPSFFNKFFSAIGLNLPGWFEGFFIFQPIGFLLFGYMFKLDSDYESWLFIVYSMILFVIYLILKFNLGITIELFVDNWVFFGFYAICCRIGMKLAG